MMDFGSRPFSSPAMKKGLRGLCQSVRESLFGLQTINTDS